MHRHMVTILYTQQCIQSPPTVVQRTRYILYTGLNIGYTGTSTLHRSELHRSYTVGQYEQAYTQATNMNRSDHIHAVYTGYTCIGSTIHRSIHGIDSTLVHWYTCRPIKVLPIHRSLHKIYTVVFTQGLYYTHQIYLHRSIYGYKAIHAYTQDLDYI